MPPLVEVNASCDKKSFDAELILSYQAVPEYRDTHPWDNLSTYSRALQNSPRGPSQVPGTRSLGHTPQSVSRNRLSLGVDSLANGLQTRSTYRTSSDCDVRSEIQLAILPGPPTRSNGSSSSSEFSNRRMSLAPVSPATSYPGSVRGSPVPRKLSELRTSVKETSDPRNLPSLFGNGPAGRMSSYGEEHHQHNRTYYDPIPTPPLSQGYSVSSVELSPYPRHEDLPARTFSLSSNPQSDRSPFLSSNGKAVAPIDFQVESEYGDGLQKRRRGNLPKWVTDLLRTWFHEHLSHPYPDEQQKQDLMEQTGLTINQVCLNFRPPSSMEIQLTPRSDQQLVHQC